MTDNAKMVRVMVVDTEAGVRDWPPENAEECLKWFSEKILSIPQEYRKSASILFGARHDYDEALLPTMEISYPRKETDEEMEQRRIEAQRLMEIKKIRELAVLAELKAKYEGAKP